MVKILGSSFSVAVHAWGSHRWVKPLGELSPGSAADDEHKVVGVSTQALDHLQHLGVRLVVNGILVNKRTIIVQQEQPLACPASYRAAVSTVVLINWTRNFSTRHSTSNADLRCMQKHNLPANPH